MRLLHNIGPRVNENYTPADVVADCNEPLSFDGVYLNVWEHRELLRGKAVTLFVLGNHVGGDNAFDAPMPPERFCTWDQVMDLAINYGCKLGWHTWSHRRLTELSEPEIAHELTPPFPMRFLAYPHGVFDERVIRIAKHIGYEDAWSVTQGDGSRFQRNRVYL